MARPVVLVLVATLAGSAALNVYQWRHRSPPEGDAAAAGKATTAAPAASATSASSAATAAKRDAVKRPAGAPPPLAATCEGQLAHLGERLAAAETKLEDRLTFDEIFERSSPTPDAEARLTPLVAKVFEKAPDGYSFDVECHGEICNVTVTEPEHGDFEWGLKLQEDVYHSEGEGHAMYGKKPSHDPVTKAALLVTKTQVKLNGADTADGMPVLQSIVEQLRASGAIAQCAAGGTRGYLTLQLWLAGDPSTITYEVGGTLASASAGQCVLRALDGVIAAATIPPRTRAAVLHHTVEL
ncbi:MAG TPA: hypothetical protein VM261_37850 [Kofleriaceae bacterium]|nr:hypothetical protein [Kofleriaceae bacterium]